MAGYVAAHHPSARFVGRCGTGKPDPRAVCGLKKATVDDGELWAIGAAAANGR